MVVAIPAQSVAHREPCHACRAVVGKDAHSFQIVADDRFPLPVREDALAGLMDRSSATRVLAVLPAGIVPAAPVAGEGISLAFPDPVSPVEAFPDFRVRFVGMPVESERVEQALAARDEMLVGVLVVATLAEQILTSPAGSEPRLIFGIMSLSSVGNRPSMAHGVYRFVIENGHIPSKDVWNDPSMSKRAWSKPTILFREKGKTTTALLYHACITGIIWRNRNGHRKNIEVSSNHCPEIIERCS